MHFENIFNMATVNYLFFILSINIYLYLVLQNLNL